jgi:hypothetical protein
MNSIWIEQKDLNKSPQTEMEYSPAMSPEKCLFAFNLVKAFRDYAEQVQGNLDLVKFDGCSSKSHEILDAFGVSLEQVQGHI